MALYLGYASRRGTALLDARLYLPLAWAGDRRRRVTGGLRYRSCQQLALE